MKLSTDEEETKRGGGGEEARAWARARWGAAAVAAVAGLVVWQFFGNVVRGYIDTGSVFWWWGWQWFNPGSEAEHGPLIVALAGWVAWRNLRREGERVEECGNAAGVGGAVGAMGAGLALHVLGYAVQQTRFSIVALLLFAWGALRLGGGLRWGRATAFPLAFLVFAIPMGALDAVGFHLRLAVIATTEVLAQGLGTDVVRNGTQLFAPDGRYQYDVAAACSGVRSLMALMALAAIVGYLNVRSWVGRAVVFLLCFPLTYVGNVVRIGAVVVAGEWIGHDAGRLVHDYAGFVVFVIVLGGVQAAAMGWAAREGRTGAGVKNGVNTAEAAGGECHPLSDTLALGRGVGTAGGVAAGVVVAAAVLAVGALTVIEGAGVPARAGVRLAEGGVDPVALPVWIGTEWAGRRAEVTGVEREILPADTGYSRRNYIALADARQEVFFSVVLSGRDRSSIHRPELCLVGQGWSIEGREALRLEDARTGDPLPVTLLRVSREVVDERGARRVVPGWFVFWFAGHDGVVATTGGRMWRDGWNRLRLRPDRWAYLVVQTMVLPGEDDGDVRARVQAVVDGVWPELAGN